MRIHLNVQGLFSQFERLPSKVKENAEYAHASTASTPLGYGTCSVGGQGKNMEGCKLGTRHWLRSTLLCRSRQNDHHSCAFLPLSSAPGCGLLIFPLALLPRVTPRVSLDPEG